tara:strand:+ start:970 stop:1350 length:381 start_codon:yes stop_codon:yes gene_type:complete
MNYEDLYRENVLLSRRDRARRALLWSRIVGIVLMLSVGVVLRSEPDLRRDLMVAGMNAVARVTDTRAKARPDAPARAQSSAAAPDSTLRPRDRIKVNRYAVAPQDQDAQGLAGTVGKTLSSRPISN